MVKTIIYHLGLGDHIMMNGLVRHFAENENVNIFVKRPQEDSVRFMYRDISDKVSLIVVDSTDPQEIWSKARFAGGTILPLATYGLHVGDWKFMTEGPGTVMTNWAHGVYIQAGVNPHYMYTKFRVDRDKSREIILEHKRYIFVHDHQDRGMSVNVDTDKYVYRPSMEIPNIFDYLSVIENADEFHGINSSYAWLVELMRIGSHKTNFFHLDVAYKEYPPKVVKTIFSSDMWTFV